jgi:hypothetical protein
VFNRLAKRKYTLTKKGHYDRMEHWLAGNVAKERIEETD